MKKLLLLFTLVFLSCVEAEDVESIIIDNNSKWVEYYNKGDAKGIASLHTLDAVVIPQLRKTSVKSKSSFFIVLVLR